MTPVDFKARTQAFALAVVRLVQNLPQTRTAQVIGNQLLRSGTSVGANYRAACRGRSQKEFVAKLGIVEEECDETLYWIELLIEANILPKEQANHLLKEGNEILRMTISSIKTARAKR